MPDESRFDQMRRMVDDDVAPIEGATNRLFHLLIDELEQAADGRGKRWRRQVMERFDALGERRL